MEKILLSEVRLLRQEGFELVFVVKLRTTEGVDHFGVRVLLPWDEVMKGR